MDWRQSQDYAFLAELDLSGWAWQFLRRAPAYRADYAWFIATWRALEADYGVPPQRDFFRWKQDPRAWRDESGIVGCGSEPCPGENEQVLIECWMGAKWGFRKFPIDPAIVLPEALAWREQAVTIEPVTAAEVTAMQHEPGKIALRFDLALPLSTQLEAARLKLVSARHQLATSGLLPPLSLRQAASLWRRWLRILDGLDDGASLPEIGRRLDLPDAVAEASAARAMSASGYRRIRMLAD